MICSLTHRMISSESLERHNSKETIKWANICLSVGIETESILILASLNEEDGTWTVRNYLEQSLGEIGLNFLPKDKALNCLIKSYVIGIIDDENIEDCLTELYNIYWDFSQPKELRKFFLIYWANKSWENNDEDKNFYIKGFKPEKLKKVLRKEANNWLSNNYVDYIDEEKICMLASHDHDYAYLKKNIIFTIIKKLKLKL